MSKSIVVELAEQGKNSYRNNAGDYLVRLPEPIVVEKGDTVAVKSVFVDNVSAGQTGKVIVQPDDPDNPLAGVNCSITFGYYYQDWGASLQTETQSKTYSAFCANQVSNPNAPTGTLPDDFTKQKASGVYYTMNRPVGTPSATIKKLKSFDIKWDGNVVNHPSGKNTLATWNVAQLSLEIADINGNFSGTHQFAIGIFPDRARTAGLFKSNVAGDADYNTITINQENLTKGFSLPQPEYDSNGRITGQSAFFHLYGGDGANTAPDGLGNELLPFPTKNELADSGKWFSVNPYVVSKNHNVHNTPWGTVGFSVLPDNQVFEVYGATDEANVAYTQTIEFNIPSGTYEPADLCKLLTDKITDTQLESVGTPATLDNDYTYSKNPLLKTIRQIFNEDDANKTNQIFNSSPAFFSQDDQQNFTYTTAKTTPALSAQTTANAPTEATTAGYMNYFVGSSQFGLSFNAEQEKVELQAIHSPLYGKDGVPQVRFSRGENSASANLKQIKFLNKNTGIYITSMSPAKLWFEGLKLPHNIQSTILHRYGWKNDGAGNAVKVHYDRLYSYVDGVNITGEEIAIDGLIEKKRILNSEATFDPVPSGQDPAVNTTTVDSPQSFDNPPIFSTKTNLDGADIVEVNSGQTRGIMGVDTLTPAQVDVRAVEKAGGYFKIEVAMPNIMPEVRESNNKNNKISSIISRYNSLGQYTSSYGEGSIPYTYNSDFPTYLSEFKIRVLEPDGKLSNKLGACSAVFLEIVKPLPK